MNAQLVAAGIALLGVVFSAYCAYITAGLTARRAIESKQLELHSAQRESARARQHELAKEYLTAQRDAFIEIDKRLSKSVRNAAVLADIRSDYIHAHRLDNFDRVAELDAEINSRQAIIDELKLWDSLDAMRAYALKETHESAKRAIEFIETLRHSTSSLSSSHLNERANAAIEDFKECYCEELGFL